MLSKYILCVFLHVLNDYKGGKGLRKCPAAFNLSCISFLFLPYTKTTLKFLEVTYPVRGFLIEHIPPKSYVFRIIISDYALQHSSSTEKNHKA